MTFELRTELYENISHTKALGNVSCVEVTEKYFLGRGLFQASNSNVESKFRWLEAYKEIL